MAKRLPEGLNDTDAMSWKYLSNGNGLDALHRDDSIETQKLLNGSSNVSEQLHSSTSQPAPADGSSGPNPAQRVSIETTGLSQDGRNQPDAVTNGLSQDMNTEHLPNNGKARVAGSMSGFLYRNDSRSSQNMKNGSKPRSPTSQDSQVESEWIELYEPGVYITLIALRDGSRELKRVRFSRRRFGEKQAESWWSDNRMKVYEKFNVRGSDRSSVLSLSAQS